jgi:hypothetical protein
MKKITEKKSRNPIEVECCFSQKTGLWSIKDKVTKKILVKELRTVRPFRGGLAAIQTFEGLWGFINKKGQIIINPDYDEVTDFQNGYAKVTQKKKSKQINLNGEDAKSPEDYQKEWAKKIHAPKEKKKKPKFINKTYKKNNFYRKAH